MRDVGVFVTRGVLDVDAAFPAVSYTQATYHARLEAIRHAKCSGVYAILDRRRVLYVGESHTGRLFDTITRHFREWRIRQGNAGGRRRGGTMYDRDKVRVTFTITEPDTAQTLQFAEIDRLKPRDNEVEGTGRDAIDLPV